jgi:hypothetical protein
MWLARAGGSSWFLVNQLVRERQVSNFPPGAQRLQLTGNEELLHWNFQVVEAKATAQVSHKAPLINLSELIGLQTIDEHFRSCPTRDLNRRTAEFGPRPRLTVLIMRLISLRGSWCYVGNLDPNLKNEILHSSAPFDNYAIHWISRLNHNGSSSECYELGFGRVYAQGG